MTGRRGTLAQRLEWNSQDSETLSYEGTPCRIWTGTTVQKGTRAMIWDRAHGGIRLAPRVSYELYVGPLIEGLTIDHLCQVTLCINWRHLEQVTNAENLRRAALRMTGCRRANHPLVSKRNGTRYCRECARLDKRAERGLSDPCEMVSA